MAVFANGKIEAYVGPPGLGAADDLEAVIVEFIAGARKKLDVAVQELDSEAVARALLAASWRGVRVTLFLEQDYLRTSLKRDKTTHIPIPPIPKPGETPEQALERVQWLEDESDLKENRRILSALLRSDIETRGDFNPEIFHQKFILRDYHEGKATSPGNPALLTGSANLTWTDTHVNHTPELEIMKQMLEGSREIVFAIFTFSGSSGIDDTMVSLARSGMTIRGVLDPTQAAHDWAAPSTMDRPNISLFVPKKSGDFQTLCKLHHKLMVIDERVVVVAGSFNYTQPANDYNDETFSCWVLCSPRSTRSPSTLRRVESWPSTSRRRSRGSLPGRRSTRHSGRREVEQIIPNLRSSPVNVGRVP
jgi:phosphatidylserine/phosphatidylglycerophosphate/cardiolipin synthase-like enzyme